MGIKAGFLSTSVLALIFAPFVNAAPMLRLVSATVGPASIAVGSNGPTQTVEAYNTGDGALALTVSSSVTWVTATVGAAGPCTTTYQVATCIPIKVSLNTASLSAGMQTGILTVNGASGTVDAPQTITVTVNMGGAVPPSLTVYVPPNGSVDVPTPTNSDLRWRASTVDGNDWLSMTISGSGSFKFVYPWSVHIAATAANVPGTYTGAMNLSNSIFTADNKSIAVTMNVTTQPIAQYPGPITVRMAQGSPPLGSPFVGINLTNLGQGTLTVSNVATSGSTCGSTWLTVAMNSTGAGLTFDPTGQPVGTCSATLTFTTNAANTLAPVPVTMQVVAKGSPLINYQGVVDNATYIPGGAVSPGDIAVIKGEQFSFAAGANGYTPGPAPPLPNILGGASATVNGAPAPLFYSFYGQLAVQIPVDAQVGTAMVQVKRDDGSVSNPVSVPVVARAPGIIVITKADYSVPNASNPAHAGDALIIWSIGMGPTSPAALTGQPAPSSPFANLVDTPTVSFAAGSVVISPATATPFFAGLAAPFAGLYQINVLIPPECPTGLVNVRVSFPDGTFSNAVQIAVQ